MPEALECWNEDLFRVKLPRIYAIIHEINERFCAAAWDIWKGDWEKIGRMSVINHSQIRMANLSVIGSHTVNGVSKLHTEILKTTVFKDFATCIPTVSPTSPTGSLIADGSAAPTRGFLHSYPNG